MEGYRQLDVTPAIEKATQAYLQEHFKLQQDDKPLKWQWIGMELEAESAYIYIEVPLSKSGFEKLALYHQVFCELATIQTNTVNFKDATGIRTQTHKRGHGFKPLSS
jgi:hypothetical protein